MILFFLVCLEKKMEKKIKMQKRWGGVGGFKGGERGGLSCWKEEREVGRAVRKRRKGVWPVGLQKKKGKIWLFSFFLLFNYIIYIHLWDHFCLKKVACL